MTKSWEIAPLFTLSPPAKVEVELVSYALKTEADEVPATLKRAYGEVVPTPTRPEFVTTRELAVELPIASIGTDELSAACMEKRAHGDDVATPTLPFEPRMVSAVSDDVANVDGDAVAT